MMAVYFFIIPLTLTLNCSSNRLENTAAISKKSNSTSMDSESIEKIWWTYATIIDASGTSHFDDHAFICNEPFFWDDTQDKWDKPSAELQNTAAKDTALKGHRSDQKGRASELCRENHGIQLCSEVYQIKCL